MFCTYNYSPNRLWHVKFKYEYIKKWIMATINVLDTLFGNDCLDLVQILYKKKIDHNNTVMHNKKSLEKTIDYRINYIMIL